jgi:hypothetical integral membrane protein (TIGR02206 family)
MFNQDLMNTFQVFSLTHLIVALIVFFLVFLVYFNRETLKEKKYYNFFRYLFVAITLGQELSLNIYRLEMGEWMISTSLPLQLCGIAMLVTSFVLITENKKVFQYTFFILMIGASLAIITPGIENNFGFPHYRFIQFFVGHGMILINITFMLFVMEFHKDFTYKLMLWNFATLMSLAIFTFIVNVVTGGNYMYTMAKPGEGTAFDLFGEYPWYIINIFFFGVPIFFHLFYAPFFIRDWIVKRQENNLAQE